MECKNNRVFDNSTIAVKSAEDAWTSLEKADQEKDLDEIKLVSNGLITHLPKSKSSIRQSRFTLGPSLTRLGNNSSVPFVCTTSTPI